MVRYNGDIVFIDTSGQVRSRFGGLTLRGDDTGLADVIVGSGASLRPETDCQGPLPIDLGRDYLRWNTLYACSGNFLERPTVNGSGVLLQGEAAAGGGGVTELNDLTGDIDIVSVNDAVDVSENGQNIELSGMFTSASGQLLDQLVAQSGLNCTTLTFTPADGTDFTLTHGLDTEDFTWAIWRTDTSPIRAVLPFNVSPVDADTVRVQLFVAITGKIVITSCGGSGDGDGGGVASSGVDTLNGLNGDVTLSSTNDGIEVNEVSQDIQLTALYTAASGALVDEALAAGGGGGDFLPSESGAIIRTNQGIAEYYLSADAGSFTTTLTTVPLDTTVIEDSPYFSRSGGVVTIGVDGIYKVSYGASINQTGGNSRSSTRHQATLNGSTLIPQSEAWVYSRNNGQGEGSVHKTFFIELDAGDTIEIESERDSGGGTFEHKEGSNLTLEFVRFP